MRAKEDFLEEAVLCGSCGMTCISGGTDAWSGSLSMRWWCGIGNVRQPWDETQYPWEQGVGTESETGCVWRLTCGESPIRAAGSRHVIHRQGRNLESCSESGRSMIRVLFGKDR